MYPTVKISEHYRQKFSDLVNRYKQQITPIDKEKDDVIEKLKLKRQALLSKTFSLKTKNIEEIDALIIEVADYLTEVATAETSYKQRFNAVKQSFDNAYNELSREYEQSKEYKTSTIGDGLRATVNFFRSIKIDDFSFSDLKKMSTPVDENVLGGQTCHLAEKLVILKSQKKQAEISQLSLFKPSEQSQTKSELEIEKEKIIRVIKKAIDEIKLPKESPGERLLKQFYTRRIDELNQLTGNENQKKQKLLRIKSEIIREVGLTRFEAWSKVSIYRKFK